MLQRLLMVLLITAVAPAMAMDLYVAPDGDDAAPGTRQQPVASLEQARDIIRARRTQMGDAFQGATVILRGGRYTINETFALAVRDSGTADAPIVYRAAESESVIFDGGHTLNGSSFVTVTNPAVRRLLLEAVRDDVVQVDLKSHDITEYGAFGPRGWGRPNIPAPMELFLDGIPQTVARWPNDGAIALGEIIDGGSRPRDNAAEQRSATFKYNTDRAQRWTQAEDLYISGLFGVTWAHDTIRIARIDTEAQTFTTDGPHAYGFRQPGFPGNFQTHYHAVNLLEEIEKPGEYYIDRRAGVLYFLPPYPLDYSRIQLSQLAAPFVQLNRVSHVSFQGIIFENSRGSGMVIRGGEHNQVVGCTFRMLGDIAISINGGVNHHVIACDVYHTGRGGISVSGGDRRSLTPAGHVVRNCDIHRYNRWIRGYNPAVSVSGVGIRVEHNHLHHALHQAITFNGNEHYFGYNEIHRVLRDISDMGSIYVGRDPTFAGNVIEHNFFHHLFHPHQRGPGVQAIFFDDDTIYVAKVFGNVFYRTGSTGVIKFHGGGGASIANNIAIASPQLVQDGPGDKAGIERAISKMHTDQPHGHGFPQRVEAMQIDQEPFRSRYPYLYDTYANRYNQGTPRWNNVELTEDQLHHFVDPDHLNFSLRDDSPLRDHVTENIYDRVQELDGRQSRRFVPIPFDVIGLKRDDQRQAMGPLPFHKLGVADGAEEVKTDAAQLWWSPSFNADGYRVILAADEQMREVVQQLDVATHNVTISGLEPGRSYYWQVEARVFNSRSNRGIRPASDKPRRFTTAASQ